MVTRIATFPNNKLVMNENLRLQYQYSNTQFQISSGLKSDNYKGIGRETQKLLSVEGDFSRINSYNEDAKLVVSRVNIMYNTMGTLNDAITSFIGQLTSAMGGNQVDPAVTLATATNTLNEVSNALNVRLGGRYLFSGNAINTPPIDTNDPLWTPQTTPSVVNLEYYQGTNDILETKISDTMLINYGVVASDPAFEQMLRGINLVMNNPGDLATLQEAKSLMDNAMSGFGIIQGVLSSKAHTLEAQMDRNAEDLAVIKSVFKDLKEVDVADATIKFNQLEVQLEASYATSSRLMRLSLVNYL